MAKSKKPKKAYTPRPMFYPRILVSMLCFKPIEIAIDNLIATQQVELDESGLAIYRNPKGQAVSFESGIRTYLNFIQLYLNRTGAQADLSPLIHLQEAMKKPEVFDEEELLKAKQCAAICREIVAKVPLSVSRDIITTMRTQLAIEKLDPSMLQI